MPYIIKKGKFGRVTPMTYKQELNVLLGLLVWFKLSHAKSWYTFQDLGKRANTLWIYFVLMMMSGAWCLMSDDWCLISDIQCLMSDVNEQKTKCNKDVRD